MPWREIEPMDEKIGLIAAVMEQEHRDRFRTEFNHERPHEALGQTAPGSITRPRRDAMLRGSRTRSIRPIATAQSAA